MLSKTSVDEVFMHHFEKMSSASGAFTPDPTGQLPPDPAGGLLSFRPPHCPPLEKIMRAPMFEATNFNHKCNVKCEFTWCFMVFSLIASLTL